MWKNQALFFDDATRKWLRFSSPLEVLVAHTVDDVLPLLATVEQRVDQQGYAAAGWISYEASPAFDDALVVNRDTSGFPLVWFGIYDGPVHGRQPKEPSLPTLSWKPTVNDDEYKHAIALIKQLIANGDTYQVNYTFRQHAKLAAKNVQGLLSMLNQQPPYFGGCISTPEWLITSGSPELFFSLDRQHIVSRPMKGTAPRGINSETDADLAQQLYTSVKNRAENVMITDMVRNDISRIADEGSLRVPEMFTIEQYPTLLQMTTTVEAETRAPFTGILKGLFPPASITGAPKARTMEIIAQLETTPRRIYTGTMGFLLPGRRAQFNVAIRTLLYDRQQEQLEYGVGSGIVWDSDPEEELQECRTKTKICDPQPASFALLETIYWSKKQKYTLLEEHCSRLDASARYFGYPFNTQKFVQGLTDLAATFTESNCKVRVTLQKDGTLQYKHEPFPAPEKNQTVTVALAKKPIDRTDRFLYHKTTNRTVYEQARAARPKADDVLLYNEQEELTESTIANIIMEIEGALYTPPLRCGLLPGTARAHLLATGQIKEKVLPVALLEKGYPLYLVNSVRGRYQAIMVP